MVTLADLCGPFIRLVKVRVCRAEKYQCRKKNDADHWDSSWRD